MTNSYELILIQIEAQIKIAEAQLAALVALTEATKKLRIPESDCPVQKQTDLFSLG